MPSPELTLALRGLLALHAEELEHLQGSRPEEHLDCVGRKLAAALLAQGLFEPLALLDAEQSELARQIQAAAAINADIAKKMLARTQSKSEFIKRMTSPSYGSNGQMKQPAASGGLLDLQA